MLFGNFFRIGFFLSGVALSHEPVAIANGGGLSLCGSALLPIQLREFSESLASFLVRLSDRRWDPRQLPLDTLLETVDLLRFQDPRELQAYLGTLEPAKLWELIEAQIQIDSSFMAGSWATPLNEGERDGMETLLRQRPAIRRWLEPMRPGETAAGSHQGIRRPPTQRDFSSERAMAVRAFVEKASRASRLGRARALLSEIARTPLLTTRPDALEIATRERWERVLDFLLGLDYLEVEDLARSEAFEKAGMAPPADGADDESAEAAAKSAYSGQNTYISGRGRYRYGALMTSYFDLEQILKKLGSPHGARLVDLGSGWGRVGFLLGMQHPEMEFDGYELVPARVRAARRVADELVLKNVRFHEQDLAKPDFEMPEADIYFAYDPVNETVLKAVLEKLLPIFRAAAERGRPAVLVAIEGRGEFHQSLDRVPWLQRSNAMKSTAHWRQNHAPDIGFYRFRRGGS